MNQPSTPPHLRNKHRKKSRSKKILQTHLIRSEKRRTSILDFLRSKTTTIAKHNTRNNKKKAVKVKKAIHASSNYSNPLKKHDSSKKTLKTISLGSKQFNGNYNLPQIKEDYKILNVDLKKNSRLPIRILIEFKTRALLLLIYQALYIVAVISLLTSLIVLFSVLISISKNKKLYKFGENQILGAVITFIITILILGSIIAKILAHVRK